MIFKADSRTLTRAFEQCLKTIKNNTDRLIPHVFYKNHIGIDIIQC